MKEVTLHTPKNEKKQNPKPKIKSKFFSRAGNADIDAVESWALAGE